MFFSFERISSVDFFLIKRGDEKHVPNMCQTNAVECFLPKEILSPQRRIRRRGI